MKHAILVALVLLAGCCSSEALRHAETQAAANWGHAHDRTLSADARAVGSVNAAAWEAQRHLLGGDPLSDEAKAVLSGEK